MSVFGGFLEEGDIERIRSRYPDFRGAVPPEARVWSERDLELFFSSKGQQRPRETADSKAQSCPLLRRLRVQLAAERVNKAAFEYVSYCRHRDQRRNFCNLPGVAECVPVQRVREAPATLEFPVSIVPKKDRDIKAQTFNLEFWQRNCGGDPLRARARWPAFEHDEQGIDTLAVDTTVAEYADYARLLESVDGLCAEENSLAYPRVQIDGWAPFAEVGARLFEACWRDLNPPGVVDLTPRWAEIYANLFELDPLIVLARSYQFSIGAPGCVSRLHCENHGAHVWFTQIEGQRLFFLFPPQEAANLYAEKGDFVAEREGYAASASSVDVFFPSQKRHPRFAEARAQVCLLGEGKTLVLPAGWWWCAVATQTSVTLRHPFWGYENRMRIVDEFWAPFEAKDVSLDAREEQRDRFSDLRESIFADSGAPGSSALALVPGARR